MSRWKKVSLIVIGILICISFFFTRIVTYVVQGAEQAQGETDLRFTEISTAFTHQSDFVAGLPFMALSTIDIDNDNIDEIFVGGGIGQQDSLQKYVNNSLVSLPTEGWFDKANDDPTYGAASIDANNDGRVDLFVARSSGVYLYENTGEGFIGKKVEFPLDKKSLPLSISFGDINNDGAVDLYVSNYIRPEYVEGETIFNQVYGGISNLLLNNGDNTFTDITKSSGVFEQHNTFTAVFVDLNNNGLSDLVVAQDTGFVRVFKNNGDLTFDSIELPVTYSYPMGIAVSDYNNDGLLDLYFSNVGKTLPDFLVVGDLTDDQTLNKDYILLENQGDFKFKDTALANNAAKYGFGWGLVSYDFNNDSLADYLITQNYIRFPAVEHLDLYPGNLLQQYQDNTFKPVEEVAGILNKHFGVTTVVSDFNQDGWPDAVIGNLNGKLRAFINNGGKRHWLKVRFKDQTRSLGAIVTLTMENGQTYTNQFYSSEGLGSDQTSDLFFGLDNQTDIKSIQVSYQNGKTVSIDSPQVDSTINLADYQ
ncbi:CRTAC1 family protein [Psychromonas sp. B3M02]|uniref:FG-GAP repeat domain-containing protein n=1 Tax=Psychromonas sp. B3M02 TaxID=2267226 RepID=UPI000DEAA416|nr:VCBS repeat-containing protein [Psychromonas sp. B3M02]RBW41636.1 CRTAC1 family protein [Psychromonas sp. B3M02]